MKKFQHSMFFSLLKNFFILGDLQIIINIPITIAPRTIKIILMPMPPRLEYNGESLYFSNARIAAILSLSSPLSEIMSSSALITINDEGGNIKQAFLFM